MQGPQPITLKFIKILIILMVTAAGSGCPHLNTGLPPSLRLPLLQHNNRASGVYHVAERDESLWNIAKTYGVDLQALAEVNNLKPPYTIKPNDKIFVPGVAKTKKVETRSTEAAEEPTVEDFSGALAWPVKGKIISEFGVREGTQYNGIGIQAEEGTPVKAAAAGKVGLGTFPPLGNFVLVEHPNRLVTIYGHLKEIRVEKDAVVKRGEVIGTVGTSGRADVPFLYFEVRSRLKPRNPLFFLDQKAGSNGNRSSVKAPNPADF